jgi:integrase
MDNQVFLDFGLRFNLRQKKIDKPTIIYAVFMWNGVQHKVNTLLKVYPSHWDSKSQSATVSNRLTELDNWNNRIINEKISSINASFLEKKYYLCKNLELDVVQEVINSINPKKHVKMKKVKVVQMTSYLGEMLELKPTKAESKYRSIINRFKKFLEEQGIDDNLALLNGDLLNDYQKWLVKQEKTIGCIRQYIQDIKTLINRGKKSHIKIDLSTLEVLEDHRSREQKKSKQVPLSEQQVLDIYNLENLSEKEEEAKDLFICQCLLGQRISDMPKIFKGDYTTHRHDSVNETISFNVQKTGEEATLFLFPIAKSIIEKYRNRSFKYYNLFETDEKKIINAERTVNSTIKKVCQKAGLTEDVGYTTQIGEELRFERKKLYELMHTHIARHTFITLMCKMGIPKEVVIIATAHTDVTMINDVYLHETASDKGKKFIEALQANGNKSVLFSVPTNKPSSPEPLNKLFAYDILIHLDSMMKTNIDAFHTDSTKQAIRIIKDISTLSDYSKEIDKEKVITLDGIIFELSYYFRDTQLYTLFQYKEYYFGIIDKIASYDDVKVMFMEQDIERPKQQLERDIEDYENYLKGEDGAY